MDPHTRLRISRGKYTEIERKTENCILYSTISKLETSIDTLAEWSIEIVEVYFFVC